MLRADVPTPHSQCSAQSHKTGLARRVVAACVALAVTLQPLAPVWAAPPVADPSAASGKRPIVDSASTPAGAVPVVHIAPPSAQGVSHNLYTQFGVDRQGLVLNNSAVATQSQLAGAISGNPQLGARAARLIVNEVNGAAGSQLMGRMEVAGQRADVVVANPKGIYCAGCGFVNMGRLTLTTGRPEWDGTGGGLTGLRVTSGWGVTVGGFDASLVFRGMDATGLAQLDLLARSVQVGGLRGGDLSDASQAVRLNMVTGPNQIAYDSLIATPIDATEPAALTGYFTGTMAVLINVNSTVRVGQISLLATEKGAGVFHQGSLYAGSGGIQLDVNGMLQVGGYGGVTLTSPTGADVVTNGGPVLLTADSIQQNYSRIDAGTGLVIAQANQNVMLNQSSTKGGDVIAAAGGNLRVWDGSVEAGGDAVLRANGTLSLPAASIKAGGQAVLASRGDLAASPEERGSTTKTEINVPILGPITARGNVTTVRKEYSPTTVEAGGDIAIQSTEGLVNLDAASVRSSGGSLFVQGQSVGLFGPKDVLDITRVVGNTTTRTWDETLVAGGLSANGDVTVIASGVARADDPQATNKGHIFISGGRIESDQGHVALLATGDIDVVHDVTQDKRWYDYYEKRRKLLSTTVTRVHQEALMETVVPSEISGNSISVGAGGDVNLVASSLTADGAIGLNAGRDLSLLSTGEQNYAYESRSVTKRGVFGSGGGLSIVVGSNTKNEVTQSRGTQQIGTAVASLGGDIIATAGNQYLQLSSELLSPVGDVHVAAKEVAIQTNNNTLSVLNSVRQTQTGVTLSASHPLVQAGQTVNDMKAARERTANPRMRALALLTSGLTMFSAYDALAGTKGSVLDYASNGWSIQASLGYSASSFESIYNSSLPQESVIVAGGDISVSATGNAAAGQGDLSVVGSALTASGNLTLRAENDIHLLAAIGRTTENTRTRASAGAIGLKAGVGGTGAGLSVTLAASRTRGFTNGWGTTYFPVELTAGDTLTLDSGRHMELVGATAGGYRVDATVGSKGSGNLAVVSPQDASHYIAKEQTLGVNVAIPIGGSNASLGLTYADLKLLADYQSAREQTAIRAGVGGYHINVNGNTHLKGGVITASSERAGVVLCKSGPCPASATKVASELTTQTLTHERIVNRDNASGQATGLTLSYGSTPGAGALAGSSFGYAQINRAGLGHTDSAVGPGTLTITRPDLPSMVPTLSRSPNTSHQPLAPTFDPARATQELRAGVAITAGFGKAAYERAGKYADDRLREAAALRARAGVTTDGTQRATLNDQANELERQWKEGGSARILLHAVIGGLNYGAGGVVGAVANQQFQQAMTTALAGSSLPAAAKDAIRTFGSALFAAGVAGAEAAGAAFNADTNNRQLHPREQDWIVANRARFAQQQGISEADAEKRLADQAFRQVQFGAAGTEDAAARQFLSTAPRGNLPGDPNVPGMNAGYMFYATPAQRLNAAIYMEALNNDPKVAQFYRQNNIQQPTVEQMAMAYARDAGQRAQIKQSTIYALLAAGALVLAPAYSTVAAEAAAFVKDPVGYCMASPQACTAGAEAVGCAAAGVACPVGSLTGELQGVRGALKAPRSQPGPEVLDYGATTQWGKGIREQGMPFEDAMGAQLPAGARLPENFKTWDYYDDATGRAISVKTLDTTTDARIETPSQVYYRLKSTVDKAAQFEEYRLAGTTITAADIRSREVHVLVPTATTPEQWAQIDRAVAYARQQNVTLRIYQGR